VTRIRSVIISGCLAVFVLADLLGVGFAVWEPDAPGHPKAVVLRATFTGGLKAWSDVTEIPDVTVYGDGRIIVTNFATLGSDEQPRAREGRLTRDAYRELYRDALLAGLGTARKHEDDEQVPDGGSAFVEFLSQDGRRRVTQVPMGADGIRAWLVMRLVDRLRDVPFEHRDDLVGPAVPYQPDRMAIVAWPFGGTAAEDRRWPLRPLPKPDPESCTIVRGNEAREAERLESESGIMTRWHSDSLAYRVSFRPLLPDEDCDDALER
jgi:hypothetical protein